MTILSIVCKKLLCTNAHLGRRVAAHHFKVYICGSRNGIAILDSDKTLICLRNALHFIGSPIRQKGRSFFLKTNHLFRYEIMEEMASCINDSQWKIGAFFTNSFANKKKFHSRKKKINFGLNQQPDCAVILNADRKSSVILEADRSQIPIASLVDSTIPWESHKRITYPIPANDPIQFVYLFRHSITKTVIQERPGIPAIKVDRPSFSFFTRRVEHSPVLMIPRRTFFTTPPQQRKRNLPSSFTQRRFMGNELFEAVAPFLGNATQAAQDLLHLQGAQDLLHPQGQGWAAEGSASGSHYFGSIADTHQFLLGDNSASEPSTPTPPPAVVPLAVEAFDIIKNRLMVYDSAKAIDGDYIDALISVKTDIIQRMAQLDPHPFWQEQKDYLVANEILLKENKEYTLETLFQNLQKLITEGQNCRFFHKVKKIRENSGFS